MFDLGRRRRIEIAVILLVGPPVAIAAAYCVLFIKNRFVTVPILLVLGILIGTALHWFDAVRLADHD